MLLYVHAAVNYAILQSVFCASYDMKSLALYLNTCMYVCSPTLIWYSNHKL